MPDPTRVHPPADPDATTDATAVAGGHSTVASELAAPPGFDRLVEVGHGGMGVVFRARDVDLSREVAVKILLPKYPVDSPTAKRFVGEARITAQLQHPGIPPVYRVGALPDGRPFLAMKLIKGQTLDALLKEHGPGSTRWLGTFEGICQAVGYAHAHGVIHRDLKPANVMVGSFGEVQVMDWGLAKVLPPSSPGERGAGGEGEPDPDATAAPDPTAIRSLRDSELLTQYGSMLGTPAFMAPEQAIGAVEQIDRRTDVFGLGAILCTLLTGRPPFVGGSAESTRQLAARGKLDDAFARLDSSAAEPDLIALCKRCLSAEKADRPADGSELATAVAALRAAADDRARHAEIDREKAEVRAAEQRTRQRVVQRAGAVLAAALALGIAGTMVGLVLADARRREADRARANEAARADGERQAKDDALTATKRAIEFRDRAVDALRSTTDDVEKLIGERRTLGASERAYLEAVARRWQKFAGQEGADEDSRATRGEGHFRVAVLWDKLGRREEARAEYERARDLQQGLATDFPDTPAHRHALAHTHGHLGHLFLELGQPAEAGAEYARGERLLGQLADQFPDALDYRKGLAKVQLLRGVLLVQAGQKKDARTLFVQVRDRLKELTARLPDDADALLMLAKSHNDVGMVSRELGRRNEARVEYEQARDIATRLTDRHPDVFDYLKELADSRLNLGSVLYEEGKPTAARAEFERVCEVRKRMADQYPGVPELQLDLGGSYNNLGLVVRDTTGPADSLPWLAKALDTLRPLHQSEPRDVTTRRYLKNTYTSRAVALDELRRYADAQADWDRVVELSEPATQPNARLLRAVARAHAGQTSDAVADAAELRKRTGWQGGDWYDLARIYAVAAGKVVEEKQNYGARAAEMLRKAVDAGFRDVVALKTVPDFAPVRDREEFKKLIADLEAKPRPK
jgi:tetratricopeptide (TPR) repeat protein